MCLEQRSKEEPSIPAPSSYPGSQPGDRPSARSPVGEAKGEYRGKEKIELRFRIPKGKVASIMGVMNLLQSKFETLEMEIKARDGTISEQDYEDKIKETFRQLGIEVEEE